MQSGSLWSGNHRRLFQYLVKRLTGGYFTQQQNSSTGRAEHNSLFFWASFSPRQGGGDVCDCDGDDVDGDAVDCDDDDDDDNGIV